MVKLLTGVICFSLIQESLWGSVWVSWGCWYEVPQTTWPISTGMCCFTVLKDRSLKSRWQQGQDPSESDKGASFLASASSEWLQANPGVPWLESHHPSLCLHHQVAVFCVCLSVSVFLIRTPVILDSGPTLLHCDLTLMDYTYNNPISKYSHILS